MRNQMNFDWEQGTACFECSDIACQLTWINESVSSCASIFSVIGTAKSIIVSFCSVVVSQAKHWIDDAVTPSKSSLKKSKPKALIFSWIVCLLINNVSTNDPPQAFLSLAASAAAAAVVVVVVSVDDVVDDAATAAANAVALAAAPPPPLKSMLLTSFDGESVMTALFLSSFRRLNQAGFRSLLGGMLTGGFAVVRSTGCSAASLNNIK